MRVQFWDIDGGELKAAMKCAQKAHAVVVVYDVTNRSSFDKAQLLLEQINPRITAMLIGNKLDLGDSRRVSSKEGKLLAKIHRVQYLETSVKHNHNIEETLQLLLACIPKEYLGKATQRSRSDSYSSDTYVTDRKFCDVCLHKMAKEPQKKEIDV